MKASSNQVKPKRWTDPSESRQAVATWEWVSWAVLIIWVWYSRWSVAPSVLFEWDSANYAMAMESFNTYEHQPHPPGYPLFVFLLRSVTWVGANTIQAFLTVNGVLASMVIVLLGWMARRSAGPLWALLLAFAFSVCPPFWSQGAVSTAYVAECFCSIVIAASALALVRGSLSLPACAVIVALALGIRPSGVVTLVPVALLATVIVRPSRAELVRSIAAFGVTCSMWFFPLISSGSGWEGYRHASDALADWQLDTGSVLSGDWSRAPHNAEDLFFFLFDCMNLLWLPLALNLLIVVFRKRFSGTTVLLFAAWMIPGILTYSLHHLAKSSYVLTLAPGTFLIWILTLFAAIQQAGRLIKLPVIGFNLLAMMLYCLLNVSAFYSAIPPDLLRRKDADIAVPDWAFVSGDYGQIALKYRTWPQDHINDILDSLDDKQDLAVFLFGSHEMHRIASYYHPQQWMAATSIDHELGLVKPATSQFPGTFGDYQLIILRAPDRKNTMHSITQVHASSRGLELLRDGHDLQLQLPQQPRNVAAFYTCPPCDLSPGQGVEIVRELDVGAGFGATLLRINPD